jgi:acyl-coenzyme A synthetase/AMP-(fatty) acid ligase
MNCIDVIFFQAEIAPEKMAIFAQGFVLSYGRLAHGIVSAQRRLVAAGLSEGQTVGVHIAQPIDHFIFLCALYRLKIASASINTQIDAYLDNVRFDAVLSDSVNSLFSTKQPAAKLFLVEPSWFKDQVTLSVAERTKSSRDPNPDWVCRVTCFADNPRLPTVVRTTSRALEAQLTTYCLAVLPDWERMLSIVALNTLSGFLFGLTALWLGRTVCFAEAAIARNVIAVYKHHYLVAAAQDLDQLTTLQATHFIAMPALRGAHVAGQRFAPGMVARCLETISSNTVVGYTHPTLGIIAYGAAARIKDIDGAVGFVAPWVELQVLGDDGAPVAPEREGELRFRDRGDQTGVRPSENAGWIYPGQRAHLMKNNVLAIR